MKFEPPIQSGEPVPGGTRPGPGTGHRPSTPPAGVSDQAREHAASYEQARSRVVYLVNQPARADGETHCAVRDFVIAADAERDARKQVEQALRDVLEWPLPNGTVEMWALPKWLAREARAALAASGGTGQ